MVFNCWKDCLAVTDLSGVAKKGVHNVAVTLNNPLALMLLRSPKLISHQFFNVLGQSLLLSWSGRAQTQSIVIIGNKGMMCARRKRSWHRKVCTSGSKRTFSVKSSKEKKTTLEWYMPWNFPELKMCGIEIRCLRLF